MKKIITLVILVMTFALLMSSCSLLSSVAGIHTVKFDLDGGENAKNFVIVMDGKTAKLPTPTREGYVFDGWYTEDGEQVTEDTLITSNLNLVAKWKQKEFKLEFDFGDVDGEFNDSSNVPETGFDLPTPEREGYDFLGWYTEDGKLFTEGSKLTEDLKLVAKWQIKSFEVTFVDYYGNTVSVVTVEYGSAANAPEVDEYVDGKKFICWSEDISRITKDVTVNAIYKQETYTVTYNCGDIFDSFSVDVLLGELPKAPKTPEADGYVFFGWYTDEELTDRYFFDYSFDTATTLYAKFYDTSIGEYIVISNVEQLMAISEQPAAKYLLACDINCKGETLTPINEFTGELEGNGYKIFNFSLTEDAANVGFIRTNKGTINDLSFADFVFDILQSSSGVKYYGAICGTNEGYINNCHTLDSELKINSYINGAGVTGEVGGLVGWNGGEITGCSNNSSIDVSFSATGWGGWNGKNGSITSYVGGICGWFTPNGIVSECDNYADINVTVDSLSGFGYNYAHIGGIIGAGEGKIEKSSSVANVYITSTTVVVGYMRMYVGGVIGHSINAKIENTYVQGEIVIDAAGNDDIDNRIGGFAGYNTGKIYGCYSKVDIKDNTPVNTAIGSFVGQHELVSGHESFINKCFALGSMEITGTHTNIGYFAGLSNANIKDAYYVDTLAVTKKVTTEDENGEITESVEAVEMTNDIGEVMAEADLLTVDFIENTLYFDRDIWFVYDGKLPVLK